MDEIREMVVRYAPWPSPGDPWAGGDENRRLFRGLIVAAPLALLLWATLALAAWWAFG